MDDLNLIVKAWTTCLEIVVDRGYTLDPCYLQITELEINHLLNIEKNLDIVAMNNISNSVIVVKFIVQPKVKPLSVKNVIDEIYECYKDEYKRVEIIIVLRTCNQSMNKIEAEYNDVQLMELKNLQMNIIKHEKQPKFYKLTDDEVKDIVSKYNLSTKAQLPIQLRSDPVSRYYNYKTGDVIKVVRNNNTYFNDSISSVGNVIYKYIK